jgi:hypothetical protein
MNWFSKFAVNLIIIFLGLGLILFTPLLFILQKDKVKSTLEKMKLYHHVTPIIQDRTLKFLESEDGLFAQVLRDNIDEIIHPSWVEYVSEKMIDEVFEIIKTEKELEDIEIDLRPVKENYLLVLAASEVKDEMSEIREMIPDSIYLTDLLSLNMADLNKFSLEIINIIRVIKIFFVILVILLVFAMLTMALLLPGKKVLNYLLFDLGIIGLILFAWQFIYRFYFLSNSYLESTMANIDSVLKKLVILIALTFGDNLSRIWAIIGIVILLTVILVKIVVHFGDDKKHKST